MGSVMPKWRVCGPRAFMGNKPGEEFFAELTPEQEGRALLRRSIELVSNEKMKLDPARVSAPEPSDEEPAEPSPLLAPEPETEDQ